MVVRVYEGMMLDEEAEFFDTERFFRLADYMNSMRYGGVTLMELYNRSVLKYVGCEYEV